MRIGVIIDGTRLARWQAEALLNLGPDVEFLLYSCTSPAPARGRLRHWLYYLLNLFTIRNRMTRFVPLPKSLIIRRFEPFAATIDGAWQSLPDELLQVIAEDAPSALVKFGMGLLRIPPADSLRVPILSYHHGDPAKYRGRPAGFYELVNGEAVVGQIVQVLSNRLDAGKIVASAETRAFAHSYRATLIESYRASCLLLRPAIRNAIAGQSWVPVISGTAFRLPGNLTVLKFVCRRMLQLAAHLTYGLTREKHWHVATMECSISSLQGITSGIHDAARWDEVSISGDFRFLADPFLTRDGSLLVEGLRRDRGCGEILRIANGEVRRVSARGGHFSYPAIVSIERDEFVVPEVSDWSSPLAYRLGDSKLQVPFELRLPGRPRLLDPTPFWHRGTLYLFGNIVSEGASVLRLWLANRIDAEFVEHPCSPVRISPNGARMGGVPMTLGGALWRPGQDLRGAYGDGLTLFQITALDRRSYAEEQFTQIRFENCRGPHTLNVGRDRIVFDYYDDVFSFRAGPNRLRQRWAARRVRG